MLFQQWIGTTAFCCLGNLLPHPTAPSYYHLCPFNFASLVIRVLVAKQQNTNRYCNVRGQTLPQCHHKRNCYVGKHALNRFISTLIAVNIVTQPETNPQVFRTTTRYKNMHWSGNYRFRQKQILTTKGGPKLSGYLLTWPAAGCAQLNWRNFWLLESL